MENTIGERIKSARLMRGLSMDDLCKKIEGMVSKNTISKYENGKIIPNSTILIAFSRALDVNVDYFFRPYKVSLSGIEFRKKSKLKISSLNGIREKVLDKIERYLEIENILSIDNLFQINYKDKIISNREEAKKTALKLREDWKIGEDAVKNVTFLLEENGIKVILVDTGEDFNGLSGFANEDIPIIIINQKMSIERQRFTAFHELGHILLNINSDIPDKEKERICDSFASEMLLPSRQFIKAIGRTRKDISLQELIPMQEQFGISIDALMYKARELDIITEPRYKYYFIKKSRYDSFKEYTNKSRFCDTDILRFESLVYKAISQSIISIGKASELLNCSIDTIRSNVNFI